MDLLINRCVVFKSSLCLLSLSVIMLLISQSASQAQVVSHELRKLAASTNQFGIDALKALDRIEPPDKVLVFCPVCLSSSLMMIMMGSSKYQVVSSLRHALYVWSLKPQEINKGFRDIFDHIGMNQQQNQALKSSETRIFNSTVESQDTKKQDTTNYLANKSTVKFAQNDILDVAASSIAFEQRRLSLPKLMRAREYVDRSMRYDAGPWWTAFAKQPQSSGQDDKKLKKNHRSAGSTVDPTSIHNNNESRPNHKEAFNGGDLSQMSATSNIYLQRGLAMNYNYNLLLRQYYRTVIHPVDFIRNGEETRQHINSLVATNTEGKIKDLVKKGTFEVMSNPRIMIISTFHFRGTLDIQMKTRGEVPSGNNSRSFKESRRARNLEQASRNQHSSRGGHLFIETEETLLKHGRFSDLDCSVIEIPFNNRLVSLVIVMPNHSNSTELVLTKLSAQVLNDMINSLIVKKISIEIPVIKFDRGPVNVEGLLKELGLDSIFLGNKFYTSETGLNKWMRPADILHETSIDIGTINPRWTQTEDRLKVGAHDSRSSSQQRRQGRKLDSSHIKLDKPFFYFVLDSINGLVLTMGRIRQ